MNSLVLIFVFSTDYIHGLLENLPEDASDRRRGGLGPWTGELPSTKYQT